MVFRWVILGGGWAVRVPGLGTARGSRFLAEISRDYPDNAVIGLWYVQPVNRDGSMVFGIRV